MKKKLLITGVSGLLGSNLAYFFRDRYQVIGLFNSNRVELGRVGTFQCDLTSEENVKNAIQDVEPDIVIHCASLTNVDQCESDKERTHEVNVKATRYISQNLTHTQKLVYISSDSVYSGMVEQSPENKHVNPQNYYGQTKFEGEKEVLKHENSLVFRTNIFGWNVLNKNSLGEWILSSLKRKQQVTGFEDASFSTIYTFELAKVIEAALIAGIKGIFNCGGTDRCSKYEFAVSLAKKFNYPIDLVKPISIDEFSFKAKRGKKLSLNVKPLEEVLKFKLPTIDHSLECFFRDYHSGLPEYLKNDFVSFKNQRKPIPYGRQWIDGSDIEAVTEVLQSDWITQGPNIERFEDRLCRYTGGEFGIAVNSGTSALHIACLAANISPGEEVLTSPITFVASANCILYCGGTPVFADIDPKTYNIDPEELKKKISNKTKAVIPVHLAGQSCDMKKVKKIVEEAEDRFEHKIWIIEDASHALGSRYEDHEVGSCAYSDMTVLSFHPVKHITTGEGGAVLTNQKELAEKLRLFKSHGITKDSNLMGQNLGSWYYEQLELGYNYRITDVQAVLGLSQMKRLKRFKIRRREIVERYNHAFQNLPNITVPYEHQTCDSNFHLYIVTCDFDSMGYTKNSFMIALKEKGVLTQVHYIPVYSQPFYQKLNNEGWGDFPNAEKYFEKCVSLPLFPAMSDVDVDSVIQSVIETVRR